MKRRWTEFRAQIIERDHDMCVRCGRGAGDGVVLQVHHKRYLPGRKPWEYPLELCETLCSGCHAAEHGIVMPKTGWVLIAEDDLGDLAGTCDLCGADLRYVFYVQHPDWGVIGVGCDCADNLTGSDITAEHRKRTNRKRAFVNSPRWKCKAGKYSISQKKYRIEIESISGRYRISINCHYGREWYPSLEIAKEKVFDVIENGEFERYIQAQRMAKRAAANSHTRQR